MEVGRLSRIDGFSRNTHVVLFALLYRALQLAPPRALLKELFGKLFRFTTLAEVRTHIVLHFERRFHVLQ